MRAVYVAGAFRAKDGWGVHQNVQRALAVGYQVAELGHCPVIPHSMSQAFDRTLTDDYWLEATMEMLRRCDAIVMVAGWEQSQGAQAERAEALRLGKQVFDSIDEMRAAVSR